MGACGCKICNIKQLIDLLNKLQRQHHHLYGEEKKKIANIIDELNEKISKRKNVLIII